MIRCRGPTEKGSTKCCAAVAELGIPSCFGALRQQLPPRPVEHSWIVKLKQHDSFRTLFELTPNLLVIRVLREEGWN